MMSTRPDLGSKDIHSENLRLKQIIEEQQRQIDAMVVGASVARSPADPSRPSIGSAMALGTPTAKSNPRDNPQLLALLDLAQRYRLCTAGQKQMMLGLVESGRFTAQYYIEMWTRRLHDLSPQSAKSAKKALSAAGSAGSAPFRPRTAAASAIPDDHKASPEKQGAAGAATFLRAPGAAPMLADPKPKQTCSAVASMVNPSSERQQQTLESTLVQPSLDVKMEPVAEAQTDAEEAWHDAPKELLRRATQTFVQNEESQEADSSGEWKGKGPDHVELTKFSTFRVRRDLFDRLRPYQRAGVSWMAQLYQSQKGGILADEMGLGKTVQTCALLSGIKKAGAKHVLLIVPVTLLDQWEREAAKWASDWRVFTYHGSPSHRLRALQGVMTEGGGILLTSYAVLKNADDRLLQVAITTEETFPTLQDEWAASTGFFDGSRKKKARTSQVQSAFAQDRVQRRPWDLIICDEAHVMRNFSTLLGKHIRNLKSNARMLLTGTPVQNALQDLWSLMDFAQPGLLGNHATFVKNVSDPIDKGSLRGANPFAVQLKKHLCEQLWDMVKPYMLRRTKESAGLLGNADAAPSQPMGALIQQPKAALPPKLETVVWLMPTEAQVKATKKLLEKSDVIQEANTSTKMGLAVFRAIGMLKRLCNHPALGLPVSHPGVWRDILSEASGKAKGKRKARAVDQSAAAAEEPPADAPAEGEDYDVSAGLAVETMLRKLPRDIDSLIMQSAKLRCLAKMLPTLGALGHRTLIFSQGLKMMDLVELCILKRMGITYLRIDGSTDVQSRADRIQQFQTKPDEFQVMLLTTGVGGYGLNLTGADRVILLDPAWNPAVDAQAVDRVYRIGQKREVRVYRLVMSGLIEDKMFRLQVFKMGLTKTALEAKQQQRYFTSGEIRGLFEWTDPAEGETRKLLLEKHGDESENVAMVNAQQDRAHEEWFNAGPAVGLSNFSVLYSTLAQEDEEPNADCEEQVAEMKTKLGSLDENVQRTSQQRQAIEEELRAAQAAVPDASKKIAEAAAAKSKAVELSKRCQAEVTKARRQEASALQHLEKVMRRRVAAREAKVNAEQVQMQADHELASFNRAVTEANHSMRNAKGALDSALQVARDTASLVEPAGEASMFSQVEGNANKSKATQKSMERISKAWDAARVGLETLEMAEEAVLTAESGIDVREKDRTRSRAAQEKAAHRVDSLFDVVADAVTGLVDAGIAFSESLQCKEGQQLTATALKAVQQTAKAKFRQLSSAWAHLKQLHDAWQKACRLRQRIAKKACAAKSACGEADAWLETVEGENEDALVAEERERSARIACEQALLDAEAQKSTAEVEHAAQKCRRSQCQVAVGTARAKLRPAKLAEKDASAGRVAVINHWTKGEKTHGQVKVELDASETSAKEALSAVSALKAEVYDANQVEHAYDQCQARKKQNTDASEA